MNAGKTAHDASKKIVYDASDLKALMDNTGGWAKNWDDVLRYLQDPAEKDANFSRKEVPQLVEVVKKLKKDRVKFTTDYRDIWRRVSGRKNDDLPPPEGVKPTTNPVELEDKYLRNLDFPADKPDVIREARKNKAPSRIVDVLRRIESKEYRKMAGLLEAVGDASWDHDRRT